MGQIADFRTQGKVGQVADSRIQKKMGQVADFRTQGKVGQIVDVDSRIRGKWVRLLIPEYSPRKMGQIADSKTLTENREFLVCLQNTVLFLVRFPFLHLLFQFFWGL